MNKATGIRIDRNRATLLLFKEAARAAAGYVDPAWKARIATFSEACDQGSKTHIAFLGTAILAKICAPKVDVFAIKAEAGPDAYSARGLCHGVLVPNAPELDINLGVTGREPLNNQPYFRSLRVAHDMPVRSTARPLIEQLCEILETLSIASPDEARQALRAFIVVRRKFGARYSERRIAEGATPEALVAAIKSFLAEATDGGRRAQAVVAGLMDVFASRARVLCSRVNDPSRTRPGDVVVLDGERIERCFEVRDKPVSREDLYHFVTKVAEGGHGEAVMVAVGQAQGEVPIEEVRHWSRERGVALTVFFDWEDLARQALLWSSKPTLEAAAAAPDAIRQRLEELEVEPASVNGWTDRFSTGE
ncbi:MAG: restriction endonuclease, SacI family [Pseudomonadota bacterium]